MIGYLCTDAIKTFLQCNIIGNTLNPTSWGTDVLSVQPDGSIEHRPQGTAGPYEIYKLVGDIAIYTPVDGSPSYGFKFTVTQ